MTPLKLGILKEGKIPYDKRVPFTPLQCRKIEQKFPHVKVYVQSSEFRCYPDEDYTSLGITVQQDIAECDLFIGIKEVPLADLVPNKKYLFFSHTIKSQPHNKRLLQEIIKKKITLIDYECLTDKEGNRIIGFGRYAGIVGAYNAILGYGKKYNLFNLKSAWLFKDKTELDSELEKVSLPNIKIVITGGGRAANGATEIMGALKIRKVTPYEFLNYTFHEPVYAKLHSKDYHIAKDGAAWNSENFYSHPDKYTSTFKRYATVCDILIHCAFWHPKAPVLFSKEDMKSNKFSIRMMADITCDINGSIPSTTRASTINDPFYDYNVLTENEEAPFSNDNITIMAVDNLPCELPKDSSADFGKNLLDHVVPSLLTEDKEGIIERATITKDGHLLSPYNYLKGYIADDL